MANGIAAGGQLTTTTMVENFPGFVEPILGLDLTDNFRYRGKKNRALKHRVMAAFFSPLLPLRKQSVRCGTRIVTETIDRVDLSSRPFKVFSDSRVVHADTLIIATGASAKRLKFKGSSEFWQRGISACAICGY